MAEQDSDNGSQPAKRTRKKKVVQAQIDETGKVAIPINVSDDEDPGDETQRRFRYQHAYGVILLTGMAKGSLPYEALEYAGMLVGNVQGHRVNAGDQLDGLVCRSQRRRPLDAHGRLYREAQRLDNDFGTGIRCRDG